MTVFDVAALFAGILTGGLFTWLFLRGNVKEAYESGRREGSVEAEKLRERANHSINSSKR